ncbi:Metallo-dependent phosphatase-like protein [Halteromyces radiatus]|uniref:Metallo-dependent phosphatase-like protein n=1 Tax=Halteromyces radiatus TaxID=101107 RepID=UPI00221F33BB|nr:Metallo-dependent phosphatase-like protein [Halteromyces radiatus]KAI8081271.1 Metallo-dependent phosphatase-like protein [Halteromyces radiatus]
MKLCFSLLLVLLTLQLCEALPHFLQSPFDYLKSRFRQNDIEAEDKLYHTTRHWLDAKSIATSCTGCISALKVVKSLSYASESLLVRTLTNVCKRTKKVSPEVCKGLMEEQLPIARKVIKTMSISGRDGHLFCAAVANSCPYPDLEPWNVTFPKEKPSEPKETPPSGEIMTILQLSDWHVDPHYEVNSDAVCDNPICCRAANTDYNNITKPASEWGEYTCDPPLKLIESMLKHIPKVEKEIEFGILTGDIPPHEIWSTLPFMKTQRMHENAYALLHTHFDTKDHLNSVLYPSVGNHEAAPTNNFPLKSTKLPQEKGLEYLSLKWLYRSLAKNWRGWLSDMPNFSVQTSTGSYVTRPLPGLKLISMNTNFCYTLNLWLYERPAELDPNGILIWLIQQLQESEDAGERVWIIGHIAPGDSTCFHDYSNYYYQIVERYAPHVIAGQFFGHTHKDELQIFYRDGVQTASNAISTAYVAPSMTPYLHVNPSFRIYKVDRQSFQVVDSITYTADLDQSNTWEDSPNWHIEYSAKQEYNSSKAFLPSTNSPLTPEWWHKVTEEMEDNQEVFNKYWRHRVRSSPKIPPCDEQCQSNAICAIRAGKSELRCDYDSDVLFRVGRPNNMSSFSGPLSEPHPCGLNLMGDHS